MSASHKYTPTLFQNQDQTGNNHIGITSMKEYEHVSYEEMRYMDYTNNKKYCPKKLTENLFANGVNFAGNPVTPIVVPVVPQVVCKVCFESEKHVRVFLIYGEYI